MKLKLETLLITAFFIVIPLVVGFRYFGYEQYAAISAYIGFGIIVIITLFGKFIIGNERWLRYAKNPTIWWRYSMFSGWDYKIFLVFLGSIIVFSLLFVTIDQWIIKEFSLQYYEAWIELIAGVGALVVSVIITTIYYYKRKKKEVMYYSLTTSDIKKIMELFIKKLSTSKENIAKIDDMDREDFIECSNMSDFIYELNHKYVISTVTPDVEWGLTKTPLNIELEIKYAKGLKNDVSVIVSQLCRKNEIKFSMMN